MNDFEHNGTLKSESSSHYTITFPKGTRSFSVKTEKEEPFIFKVGDIVTYHPYGDREFELKDTHYEKYPLRIEEDINASFSSDGKYHLGHARSSLTLVRRPKKMVEKEVVRWMNVYKNGATCTFININDAKRHAVEHDITTVELKGSYWVEE